MKNKILEFLKKNKKIRLRSINKKRKPRLIVYKRLSYNINLKDFDINNKYIKPLNNKNKSKRITNLKNKDIFIVNNYNNYESSKSYVSFSPSVFENIKNPEERRNYIEDYRNQF